MTLTFIEGKCIGIWNGKPVTFFYAVLSILSRNKETTKKISHASLL